MSAEMVEIPSDGSQESTEVQHHGFTVRLYRSRLLPLLTYYREYLFLALCLLPFIVYFVTLGPIIGALPKDKLPSASLGVLPFCDHLLLLGFDLRAFLSRHTCAALDILAGVIYIYHFISPVCNSFYFWLRSQSIVIYCLALGVLNLAAVSFQVGFPTAPPWFVDAHPDVLYWHSWNVTGSAAGLNRVDALIGFDLFGKLYGSSTLVFGSFPSLHAAWPFLAFSVDRSSTRWIHAVHYVLVSWAAMYLNHHYLVDVLGGAFFAGTVGVSISYFVGPKVAQLWDAIRRKEADKNVPTLCGGEQDAELGLLDSRVSI